MRFTTEDTDGTERRQNFFLCVLCVLCGEFLLGCGGPSLQSKSEPKLKAARPEAVEALNDAARLVRLGAANYPHAVERLREATTIDPGLWEAYYDLGWIELKQHHPQAAADALEKAQAILPGRPATAEALGEAYFELGRPADAVAVYRKLLEKKDLGAELAVRMRIRLGEALRKSGKLDEAIDSLQKALRQAPRSTSALNALALVYQARGQHELSDLVLHRALEVDDKSKAAAETWNNLGLVALSLRQDQAAFAHFDQASRLDPALTVARRNKALVYLDCGDYPKAADELSALTKGDAVDVDTWVALGVAERGLGRFDPAAHAFEKALELEPTHADALYDLGVLFMDFKKDKTKAQMKLSEFLKLAPLKHPRRSDAESRMKELAPRPAPGAPLNRGGSS
jgi:tetratricopeptide (TPR) repeat protein